MFLRSTLCLAVSALCFASHAQVIKMNPQPYTQGSSASVASPMPAAPVAVAAPSMLAQTPPANPAPPAALPVQQVKEFYVAEMDRNVREVLQRWASQSGWRFGSEHWSIDRDLPIYGQAGPDVFGTDFYHAVRTLLQSTEMTDRPVQPCFYPNRVLRVIARTGSCSPGSVQFETPSRPVDMSAIVKSH